MSASAQPEISTAQHYRFPSRRQQVQAEVIAGLRQTPKRIDSKYFYDDYGSRLFERIVTLREYYPPRCEREILQRHAAVIAARVGPECVLIEPGSGASRKVELLLDALRPSAYVAVDISAEQVQRAGHRLAATYPWLRCHTVAADYNAPFELPAQLPAGRRVIFYPGSTLGNFEPAAAAVFLRRLRALAGTGGGLLIGIDLRKDTAVLERAYNDRLGVTAEFNKNALRHLNRLTGADFNLSEYDHVAFYNESQHRIEMHLQCRRDQRVTIDGTGIDIAAGERIHTENSYKYTTASFTALARCAGFERVQTWYDREQLFSVHYLTAAAQPGG